MRNQRLWELSIMRQRRKRNLWVKKHNRWKYSRKKNKYVKQNTLRNKHSVIVPMDFSMDNLEESLRFLNTIYNFAQNMCGHRLFVSLTKVQKIDMFTICLFLSMVNKLSRNGIVCWGNYPDDKSVKYYILNSGFLKVLNSNISLESEKIYDNQMYMIGKGVVCSRKIGISVKTAMKQLLGREIAYPPVYDNLIEICTNSVEHSNNEAIDKNWLISISKKNDSIQFILTDTGLGILKTLHKKGKEFFRDKIFRKDGQVLNDIFNKKYQSRTGELNRHKGLPIVLESFNEGFILNLKVLTNCVLYDFKTNSFETLKNEFKGTLICWTVDEKNYQTWEKSIQVA